MGTVIRHATRDDAAAICSVLRRSITACCAEDHHDEPALIDLWLKNKTIPNTLAWLENPLARSVVAETDGSVVGFGMSQGDEILLCYLVPELRFKGVGKALLQALEAHALEAGMSTLRLESTRTALPFYERNGFRQMGPAITAFGLVAHPMTKTIQT